MGGVWLLLTLTLIGSGGCAFLNKNAHLVKRDAVQDDPLCPYQADIMLLMDASSSIGPDNYEKMKVFLKGVISHFDIGQKKVRIGLITYNFGADFEFYLNTYETKAEILAAFDKIQDTATGTTTHQALKFARITGFTAEHGDRPGVPNIAILLTDGRSTNPEKTAKEQALLKATGARIFAVGIGWTDEKELKLIASDPDQRYFQYVKDFDGLKDILSEFKKTACAEITRPPPTMEPSTRAPTTSKPTTPVPTTQQPTQAPTKLIICPFAADVIILMDASSSIGDIQFQKMKEFLVGIVKKFDIAHDLVRVGLITFNFGAEVEFLLNNYTTKADVINAIESLTGTEQGTATHRALKFARTIGFQEINGDRPDIPNIAILVTDGRSTLPNRTEEEQALLKATGARVFSIGIGWTLESELRLIASNPKDKYFHYVTNFEGLDDILEDFRETACNEMTRTEAPTTTTLATTTVETETPTPLTTSAAPTTPPPTSATTKPPVIICPFAADVIILMDASSSIGDIQFQKMKEFLVGIVEKFDIAHDLVRVGLITFNFGAEVEFLLNNYTTKADVINAIQSLHGTEQGTATHRALKFARTIGFQEINGDRPDIPNIAILVTDGRSTHPNKTEEEQALLKATGARVFSIGIGWTLESELRLIASNPKDKYFHYVTNFEGLDDILEDFRETACNEMTRTEAPTTTTLATTTTVETETPTPSTTSAAPTTPPPTSATTKPPVIICPYAADVIILMDASSSIGDIQFQKMKDFLVGIVEKFDIAHDLVRVGLITFNFGAEVEFLLNNYTTKADVINAIKSLHGTEQGTATHRALKFARTIGFQEINGDRPDIPDIVILVTDGRSTHPNKTEEEQALLKATGARVFSIGIGWTLESELRLIASNPKDKYFHYVTNFEGLDDILEDFRETACNEMTRTEATTTTSQKTETPTPSTTSPAPTTPTPTPSPTPPICLNKGDVAFVIDTSSSIGPENLAITKAFIKDILEVFDIRSDGVRVAMVTFDQYARVEFNLARYTTYDQVLGAVNSVVNTAVGTNTHFGLEKTREEIFSGSDGDRPNVQNIVIVITDGRSRKPELTAQQAIALRETGAMVFAIGVGWVDPEEINIIASDPDEYFAFPVGDHHGLAAIKEAVVDKTCDTCHLADMVIVMDRSSSINETDYQKMRTFVTKFIDYFVIGEERVRVGLVSFANDATIEFYLNSFYTTDDIVDAIDNANGVSVGTRTDLALAAVREDILTAENGDRPGTPDILVTLTDGGSRFPDLTAGEAEKLRAAGTAMFSIGIGRWINNHELRELASAENHVFRTDDFDGLDEIRHEMKKTMCYGRMQLPTGCNMEADVFFVFDSSMSLSASDFEESKKFATDLVKDMRIAKGKARIAAIKYNDDASLVFPLDFSFDKQAISKAIMEMEQSGPGSHVEKALQQLSQGVFKHGDRESVPDVAIVFTTGKYSDSLATRFQANQAANAGIRVYSVGIGHSVNTDGLKELTVPHTSAFTFSAKPSTGDIGRARSSLITAICKEYSPCD